MAGKKCQIFFFLLIFQVTLSTSKRPNIVLIVADDLGWGDVSFHGSTQVQTPDIDDLATDGIVLNNYYVSPICTPSRGALLSGRHPIHTGLQYDVIQGETPYGLPLQFDTLPQYLKELGYVNHAIGKWHIGHHTMDHLPTKRGFDTFFGYLLGAEDYYDHTATQMLYYGMDLRRNLTGIAEEYFGQYSTTMYTNEAVEVIKNHNESSNGPMFLYLAYQAIHVGNKWSRFQVPKEFEDRFSYIENEGRRKIVAMGNSLNDAVATIVETLGRYQLLDNTIIAFTTDNGGATGPVNGSRIDDSFGSNWPLRGTKFTLWEGGVRAIGFLWSPLLNQSSYTYNGLMHVTDWLPTLFAAAGGDSRTLPSTLYGQNLWPDLNRASKTDFTRNEILHNIDDIQNIFSIRSGNYKLKSGTIKNGNFDGWYLPPGESIKKVLKNNPKSRVRKILETLPKGFQENPDFPILLKCQQRNPDQVCDLLKDKLCLFNISEDPCEYNNIVNKFPSVVEQLLVMMERYNRTAVKPGFPPLDQESNPALHNYYWGPWISD